MMAGSMQKIKAQRIKSDFEAIVSVVAEYFDLSRESIVNPSNKLHKTAYVRQCVMHLCYKFMPFITQSELAKHLGGSDHTSIHYGLKALKKRREANKKTDAEVTLLETLVGKKRLSDNDANSYIPSLHDIRAVGKQVFDDLEIVRILNEDDFVSYLEFVYAGKQKRT
jgi:hypothetical protein